MVDPMMRLGAVEAKKRTPQQDGGGIAGGNILRLTGIRTIQPVGTFTPSVSSNRSPSSDASS